MERPSVSYQTLKKKKSQSLTDEFNVRTLPRIHNETDNVFEDVDHFMNKRSSFTRSRVRSYPSYDNKSTSDNTFQNQVTKNELKRASSNYKNAVNEIPSFVLASTRNGSRQKPRNENGVTDKYTYMPAIHQDTEVRSKLRLADLTGLDLMNSQEVSRMMKRESTMRNISREYSKKSNIHLPRLKHTDNLSTKTKSFYLSRKPGKTDGRPVLSRSVSTLEISRSKRTEPKSEQNISHSIDKRMKELKEESNSDNFIIEEIDSKECKKHIHSLGSDEETLTTETCKTESPKEETLVATDERTAMTQNTSAVTQNTSSCFTNRIKHQSIINEYTSILINNDDFSEHTPSNTEVDGGTKPRTVRFNVQTHVREYKVDVDTDDEDDELVSLD